MFIDIHSHVWDLDKHTNESFRRDLGNSDSDRSEAFPERHWEDTAKYTDKTIVFGLKGVPSGINVPDEYVASYVNQHPDQLIGFMSIDPMVEGPEQIEYAYYDLKLRGIKTSPIYTNCSLLDYRFIRVFEMAQKLHLPVMLHTGATFPRLTQNKYDDPCALEEIALRFPDVVIIVAHLGYPKEKEYMHIIRKHPNLYTDISSVVGRPWEFYNNMMIYYEWGHMDKILFGTDYPWGTAEETKNGLLRVNEIVKGTGMTKIPEEKLYEIIERDSLRLLGLE